MTDLHQRIMALVAGGDLLVREESRAISPALRRAGPNLGAQVGPR